MKAKNILLTGPPGCGKSTLIEKLIRRIDRPLTGFFTGEIRERGRRVGFGLRTLDGREGILAHVNMKSRTKVGKYGVNLEDLERIAVPAMIPSRPGEIVVIDEIGKMECFSRLFRETLVKALDSPNRVIASIALKGTPFIEEIKKRPDVRLVRITPENRNDLVQVLVDETLSS